MRVASPSLVFFLFYYCCSMLCPAQCPASPLHSHSLNVSWLALLTPIPLLVPSALVHFSFKKLHCCEVICIAHRAHNNIDRIAFHCIQLLNPLKHMDVRFHASSIRDLHHRLYILLFNIPVSTPPKPTILYFFRHSHTIFLLFLFKHSSLENIC